ncbi:glutamyl-tRNA reductase [Ferrovum sp. PN-J185]|uniref:glutamyl-tRNA reductase n=1 Tax=Ferrovum sp. PN-J185 TaxID=1356306 RepID=UPI001E645897|nr:glutamyl-tRNA reductase [Ferrovum sp. PN-J185]
MADSTSFIHTFGLNHDSAPLAVRERIAFNDEQLIPALIKLSEDTHSDEAVILSTCNRTEIYVRNESPTSITEWLQQHHHLGQFDISQYLYQLNGSAVAHHAFKVASGLDSMVLGEPQILGQVKQAVRIASEAGTLGPMLDKLFQITFSVAKEVRSQTAIGERSVSLAAAALKLTHSVLGNTSDQKILFIGAGEMIELVATHFAAKNPQQITIANRTLERGRLLAERFKGQAVTLSELTREIPLHDVIISCTASHLPLIGKGMIENALKSRKHKPMVLVDLAVPRDIEPEVGKLSDIFLYTVDDLGEIVQENKELRQAAVEEAEKIISVRVQDFIHWLHTREVVPTIKKLREHADNYRRMELEKAKKALLRGDSAEAVIEQLANSLMNKFLHHPTQTLNQTHGEHQQHLIDAAHKLFIRDQDS